MDIFYVIFFFVIGIILGSFFNVVGLRLPKGESIIYPASHCPNCENPLKYYDLIPIFSYIFLKGKCRYCNNKISLIYPVFEIFSGILFALAYYIFKFDLQLIIALSFISMSLIIIVSDIKYMIIPDKVLILFAILFLIEIFLIRGFDNLLLALKGAFVAFAIMYLIKKMGDFLFKKESMGGADIKLMFIFGLIFGYQGAIISIFLASLIGLPISLVLMFKNDTHEVPFGPYLSLAGIILLFLQIDSNFLINLFK